MSTSEEKLDVKVEPLEGADVEREDGTMVSKFMGMFFTEEVTGGRWQATVLLETPTGLGGNIKQTCTFGEGDSEEEAVAYIHSRWPEAQHVSKKELDLKLYEGLNPSSMMGGTGKRVVGSILDDKPGLQGHFFKEPSQRKTYTPRAPTGPRPGVSKVPLPEDVTDDTLLPAVKAAKYLGVPPQYVYNRLYHGKLKAYGDRPKKVRWGDARRQFGQ